MTMTAETREISSSGSFFESNRAHLANLFEVLGMPRSDDLEEAVAHTQHWVKGDHHTPVYDPVLTLEQDRDARLLFGEMGLTKEQAPPPGEYQQVVILGGMMGINNDRTRYATEQLARPDVRLAGEKEVVFLSGPRAPLARERDDIEKSIVAASEAAPDDPWLRSLRLQDEKLLHETSQARLSLLTHFGSLALSRIDLRVEDSELVKSHTFDAKALGTGAVKLVVINSRIVSRENVSGQPRPTTGSCAEEWLVGDYAPSQNGSRVMLVANNPHIKRTTTVMQNVANELGADVELVGCGPAAYEDAKISLYLGEVGRLLYADLTGQ